MPLETDFICTLKDLKKANRARMLATIKSNWLVALLILIGIPALVNGQYVIAGEKGAIFSWISGQILLFLVLLITLDIVTKMQFDKNKTTGNLNIHFTFYEDEFQMQTPLVKNMISFDALHSIDESKDFFFLKLAPSKMVTVQKQNCSPELISFLQQKAVDINSRSK